jgi:starch phosphorylase
LQAHAAVAELYRQRPAWATKAILNVARMGKFSSDTSIRRYAQEIWNLRPIV